MSLDPINQVIFVSPNGGTMVGSLVPVACAPNVACDVSASELALCTSPGSTPRSSAHEGCPYTPLLCTGNAPCLGDQHPSLVGVDMQFAVPQFPCLPGTASDHCIVAGEMPCAMTATSCGEAVQQPMTPVQSPGSLATPSQSPESLVLEETPEKSQKVAFDFKDYVSAPSFLCSSDIVEQLGHPMQITKDPALADQLVEALQDAKNYEAVVSWFNPFVVKLSLNKFGTRVVQAALDHGNARQRCTLISSFRGYVMRLMDDFNGNHVIQKIFEVVSGDSQSVKFIVDELAPSGQEWSWLVTHKFGCRVAQRVVEHCTQDAVQPIVDTVLAQPWEFVNNEYANYVVQSILQNGSANQRYQIVYALIELGIPNLTLDQVPATIVEKAFEHGDEKCREALGQAILQWSGAIVRMSCNRWGCCIVKRLLGVVDERQKLPEPLFSEAIQQLVAGTEILRRSKKHGRKFAQFASEFQQRVTAQAGAGGA